MDDKPPADLPKTPTRLITGVDNELLRALRASESPAGQPTSDSTLDRSIASILHVITSEIVCGSEEGAVGAVDLRVVLEAGDERLAEHLGDILARRLPRIRVEATAITVEGAIGGALGDLAELFSAGEDRVLVNGQGAEPEVLRALTSIADAWGVPVLLADNGRVFKRRPVGEIRSSLLLGALRFALTEAPTPEKDLELISRRFEGLLIRQGEKYRPTRTLEHMLSEGRFIGLPDHFSACAELLETRGEPAMADELRRLIDRWVRHRVWSINYVPEMVLHDEAHSVAVDRNVASLGEPLLNEGRIDERDLLVLALCAWLHDWGHASAQVEMEFPTDPIDVRNFHGLLTAEKLKNEAMRHGVERSLASEVALYCGHHQGWTSAGERAPTTLPERSKLGTLRTAVWDGRGPRPSGLLALAFDLEFDTAFPRGKWTDDERRVRLEKAHLKLALLRLADAADVGAHRVPDFGTQYGNRVVIANAFYSLARRIVGVDSSAGAGLAGRPASIGALSSDPVTNVGIAYSALLTRVQESPGWDQETLDAAIKESASPLGWIADHGMLPPPEISGIAVEATRAAWTYMSHVVRQAAFYQQHRQIRAVVPTLERDDSGEFHLVAWVLPLEHYLDDDHTEAIRTSVRKIISREYGHEVKAGREVPPPESDQQAFAKRVIADYLGTVAIRVPDVEVRIVPFRQADVPKADAALRPRTPRTALPYRLGSSVQWLQVEDRSVSRVDMKLTRRIPEGRHAIAFSQDGRLLGACVGSMLRIFDASTGDLAAEHVMPAKWEGASLLSLRVARASIRVVVGSQDEVASINVAFPDPAVASWAPAAGATRFVRVVDLGGSTVLMDEEGRLAGGRASILSADGVALASADAIAVGQDLLCAIAREGQDTVEIRRLPLAAVRRADSSVFEGAISASAVVDDLAWVRGTDPAASAELIIATAAGLEWHSVGGPS